MILSDREIQAAIRRGSIGLSPPPEASAFSSTAVDLRLAPEMSTWKPIQVAGANVAVSPADAGYSFLQLQKDFSEQIVVEPTGYVMKSGTFLLAWTIEKIKLPHQSRLAARVEGKSSLARLGIGVHVTAPTIHAGFGYKPGDDQFAGNPIQLEVWNVGPLDIRLVPGMPICQVIFELVDGTPEKGYEGRFLTQGPPALNAPK